MISLSLSIFKMQTETANHKAQTGLGLWLVWLVSHVWRNSPN